jgi:hypothetical protein
MALPSLSSPGEFWVAITQVGEMRNKGESEGIVGNRTEGVLSPRKQGKLAIPVFS